jgi:hypothetical protein
VIFPAGNLGGEMEIKKVFAGWGREKSVQCLASIVCFVEILVA